MGNNISIPAVIELLKLEQYLPADVFSFLCDNDYMEYKVTIRFTEHPEDKECGILDAYYSVKDFTIDSNLPNMPEVDNALNLAIEFYINDNDWSDVVEEAASDYEYDLIMQQAENRRDYF